MNLPLTLPPALSQLGSHASSAVAPQPRLVHAAHEFEAAMMKELIAPMDPGHDFLGDDEEAGSSSSLTSFAQEALGKAISEHGGLGIAQSVLHQLGTGGNHSGKSLVPEEKPLTSAHSPFK